MNPRFGVSLVQKTEFSISLLLMPDQSPNVASLDVPGAIYINDGYKNIHSLGVSKLNVH